MLHFDRLGTARWLSVLVVCLSVTRLTAQQDPCLLRTIPLTILDQSKKPVSAVVPGMLSGKLHGKPVEILSINLDQRPRRMLILLDASGSMSDTPFIWKAALYLAIDAALRAPENEQVALGIFGSQLAETVGFEKGSAAVVQRLMAMSKGDPMRLLRNDERKTALIDSIVEAMEVFHLRGPEDVVYVITDGDDNQSKDHPREVKDYLSVARARLFVFLLQQVLPVRSATPVETYGPDNLLNFVKMTGGTAVSVSLSNQQIHTFDTPAPKDATNRFQRQVFQEMANMLYHGIATYYQVEVKLPIPLDKPHGWELKVAPPRGVHRDDISIFYPTVLLPCSEVKGNSN
jgi:hypothetical protein